MLLEWNVNKDALTEDVAGNSSVTAGTFGWSANETWALGSVIGSDLNPDDADDFPSYATLASSDMNYTHQVTGTTQVLNVSVSGRAGYARFKTSYEFGAGDDKTFAHNQYWPVIVMLS